MRLIDADELMESLGMAYECKDCENISFGGFCKRTSEFVHACQSICEAPTIEESRWIPIDERLPNKFDGVLATVKTRNSNHYVQMAYYNGEEWRSVWEGFKITPGKNKVIAWMPLPEPWKEEGDE